MKPVTQAVLSAFSAIACYLLGMYSLLSNFSVMERRSADNSSANILFYLSAAFAMYAVLCTLCWLGTVIRRKLNKQEGRLS